MFFARLAFHDCVGGGHCDGCINHTLPDNAGLKTYTDALDIGYNSISATMSRTDFYALASLTALKRATFYTDIPFTALEDGKFKVGRIDCSLSPNEDAAPNIPFPSGDFHNSQTLNFFVLEFGFNADETVALLGAHTLGRAHAKDSGYEGKWVSGKVDSMAFSDRLENGFYHKMLGNWKQVSYQRSVK